jgi:L-alanine-DL-glutamate epimerase-like enolase superfamily enzyme
VVDEISMADGKVTIPQKPGLGVELNRDALAEFVAAAKKLRD